LGPEPSAIWNIGIYFSIKLKTSMPLVVKPIFSTY
jgi:hypothetical protein